MSALWQQILVGLVIVGAAGYLLARYLHYRKRPGCSECAVYHTAFEGRKRPRS